MSQIVPTLALPYYTVRVRLEEQDYALAFQYSTRAQRYYLTIRDAEDKVLVRGLKLLPDVSLLRPYRYRGGLPPGELRVTVLGPDTRPPGIGEIGEGLRCSLTYFTRAELLAL